MLNLLSGELYKLRKSKCFLVCLALMVVSVIFMYGTLYLANEMQQGEIENGTAGVVVSVDVQESSEGETVLENIMISEVLQVVMGGFCSFIVVIFNAIYVIGEFGHGAIKNMAGKGYSRSKIFISKYVSCLLGTVVMLVTGAVSNLAVGCIVIGTDSVNGVMLKDYTICTLLMSGLILAISSLVVAISEISRNLAVGISIAVCIVGGISSLIFLGVDLVLKRFSVQPSQYWLMNLLQECPYTDFGGEIVQRIIVSIVFWTSVSIVIGLCHFRKADIK